MSRDLAQLTEQLLSAALAAGAESADALAIDGTSVAVDVRNGFLEQAERSESTEVGLRVFIGRRQASVAASDTSKATIETLAQRAVAMAAEAPDDPFAGLADPSEVARDWDLAALDLADPADEPPAATLEAAARDAEAAAIAVDGVSQVQSANATYGRRRMHLAATNGFIGGYVRTDNALSAVAISGQGSNMERDYSGEVRVYANDLPRAEDVGRKAGERAAARAGAKKPPTGAFPVLFDERVSSSLIDHVLSAVNGAAIARGASWLRDAEGKAILPPALSVIEDPHKPRGSFSRPFDGEGIATQRRTIVENGVLTGWTLDLSSARKLGRKSTGNASRGTSGAPMPSHSNILLTPGTHGFEDLVRDMGTGILVTSLIGSTINPNTGDYSRGASGFWVENGEITYPVNECTIAGNLLNMLKTLVPADDARPYRSRVVPSLLVEGLTIAGA